MINGRTRVRTGTWFAMLDAERERRRLLALSPSAEAAAAALLGELEKMAERLQGASRPGEPSTLATELLALVREKDDAGLEACRLKYDLSPAEIVARLIAAGESEIAFEQLDRYAAAMPAAS